MRKIIAKTLIAIHLAFLARAIAQALDSVNVRSAGQGQIARNAFACLAVFMETVTSPLSANVNQDGRGCFVINVSVSIFKQI